MMRTIIGTDDRYMVNSPENNGIVRLSNGCTGFIVGDHEIATNAHAVYYSEKDTWKEIEYIDTYDNSGSITNVRLTPIEAHFPSNFHIHKKKSNGDYKYNGNYDYALITVKENLSKHIHFDLGVSYNLSQSNFANIPIYVTGCPQSTNTGAGNGSNHLFTGEGRILDRIDNSYKLSYNADTTPGNSGSPVYTITQNYKDGMYSYTYTAIAVHNAGSNEGPRMTKYLLQFYRNNPNINY